MRDEMVQDIASNAATKAMDSVLLAVNILDGHEKMLALLTALAMIEAKSVALRKLLGLEIPQELMEKGANEFVAAFQKKRNKS